MFDFARHILQVVPCNTAFSWVQMVIVIISVRSRFLVTLQSVLTRLRLDAFENLASMYLCLEEGVETRFVVQQLWIKEVKRPHSNLVMRYT